MSEEQRAFMAGDVAWCYSCRTLLAARGATVRLANGLVPRPEREPATGLPRYGLARRPGRPRHADGFLVNAATRDIGDPGAIYVNCPTCDRGQVVRWPSRYHGTPPLP
jgi:hypothetical protein